MTRSLALCIALVTSSSIFAADPDSIVYNFSAVWCGPCQQMAPLVERLKREGLPIRKVDFDKEKSLAAKYNITSLPTFVVVVNGKEVQRQSGAVTESSLRRMIAKVPASAGGNIAQPRGHMGIQLGAPSSLTGNNAIASAENDEGLVIRGNDAEIGHSGHSAPLVNENHSTDPMDSSVRIRVTVAGKVNLGSGTIIYSREGMSKILTCAHIFRDFDDDSKIEVDIVINNKVQPYIAKLDNYNEEADLGLITVSTSSLLPVAAIAQVDHSPKLGEAVSGIGCSGGDDPTREQLQVTAIDKYVGSHNIECTGLPVGGRSGGGLFNSQGEVVGVCIAADREYQRGLYSGLLAVHSLLDKNNLAHLFKPATTPASSIAATPAHDDLSHHEHEIASNAPANEWASDLSANTNSPSTQPIAPVKVQPIDLKTGGAEVVVIIRDPNNPQLQNRVVILHAASPKFISYLNGELEGNAGAGSGMVSRHEHVPANARQLRAVASASNSRVQSLSPVSVSSQHQLQPTSLSQPVTPRRYVRTAR